MLAPGSKPPSKRHGQKSQRQDHRFAHGAHLRVPKTRSGLKSDASRFKPAVELRPQFVGAVHGQLGIVHDEASVGRERDRLVDCFQALAEQLIVAVQPVPSFAVVAVGNVELRPRIALGRVGAGESGSSGRELILSKERQAVGECLLVDAVRADRRPPGHL